MTKEQLQGTKIRVTPEQSAKVQQYAFEQGLYWTIGKNTIQYCEQPFLFLGNADGLLIEYGLQHEDELFKSDPNREIFFSDLFPDEVKETKAPAQTWDQALKDACNYYKMGQIDACDFITYCKQNFHAPIPKEK